MFAAQTLVFTYHYHLFLADSPPIAATTVPYGVPALPCSRAAGVAGGTVAVEKSAISAPTPADPAALEAGARAAEPLSAASRSSSLGPGAAATPPPPLPPVLRDSPAFGAGGGVAGGEKRPSLGSRTSFLTGSPYPADGAVV